MGHHYATPAHVNTKSLPKAPKPCPDPSKGTAKLIACAASAAETGSASEGIVREFTDALAKDTDIAVAVAVIKVCNSIPPSPAYEAVPVKGQALTDWCNHSLCCQ